MHNGTTYSHKYKGLIDETYCEIRKINAQLNDGNNEILVNLKIELKLLDSSRRALEKILLKVYASIVDVLKVAMSGNKKNTATSFGGLDAETDGIGSLVISNMLELPGSIALAIKRLQIILGALPS